MNPLFIDRFQSGEIQSEFAKIKWKDILFAFTLVLMLCSALAFDYGAFLIMSGWHSLDLAQDITHLTYGLGHDPTNLSECNLGGECFSLDKTYLDGANRMFRGINLTISMAMVLVCCVCLLCILYGEKGTKRGAKK
jgi:hypothetical protein